MIHHLPRQEGHRLHLADRALPLPLLVPGLHHPLPLPGLRPRPVRVLGNAQSPPSPLMEHQWSRGTSLFEQLSLNIYTSNRLAVALFLNVHLQLIAAFEVPSLSGGTLLTAMEDWTNILQFYSWGGGGS